jgi:hypothetical protein
VGLILVIVIFKVWGKNWFCLKVVGIEEENKLDIFQ